MKQPLFKKNIPMESLIDHRSKIEDINYWRSLNPNLDITHISLKKTITHPDVTGEVIAGYKNQLTEEGYFQSMPLLPTSMTTEMFQCIEVIKKAGLPLMFALVYDIFYAAFQYLDTILTQILGESYKLIPHFWLYYIEPTDHDKGFQPHRDIGDAGYRNTIGDDGVPSLVTVWLTVTEATPLNSCIYILPKNHDPQYLDAISDPKTSATEFALQDIRALPTQPGVLSCWDQYVYHWGSRSSKHTINPRVSYAFYCQRGDIPPYDNIIDLRAGIDFSTRLAFICHNLYRYTQLSSSGNHTSEPLIEFLMYHANKLKQGNV